MNHYMQLILSFPEYCENAVQDFKPVDSRNVF